MLIILVVFLFSPMTSYFRNHIGFNPQLPSLDLVFILLYVIASFIIINHLLLYEASL